MAENDNSDKKNSSHKDIGKLVLYDDNLGNVISDGGSVSFLLGIIYLTEQS